MTGPKSAPIPDAMVRAAAAAIANVRLGARGIPLVTNVLEMMPPSLAAEITDQARAALEAAAFGSLLACLKEAVASWELQDEDADVEPEDGDPLAEWKAAIAKAEGRS